MRRRSFSRSLAKTWGGWGRRGGGRLGSVGVVSRVEAEDFDIRVYDLCGFHCGYLLKWAGVLFVAAKGV